MNAGIRNSWLESIRLGFSARSDCSYSNSFTSEGILGIDFLETNGCALDLSQGKLVFRSSRISLCARNPTILTAEQLTTTVRETFTVAICSEREMLGEIPVGCTGVAWEHIMTILRSYNNSCHKYWWFLKNHIFHNPFSQILKLEPHPITVYNGTKVAVAEAIDSCMEVSTVNETNNPEDTGRDWVRHCSVS